MDIKLDVNAAKVRAVTAPTPVERPSKAAEAATDFREAAALERALKNTPDVRAAEVERGRKLLAETNYPPREAIQKLSTLLAMKLSSEV